jgi:hypothetical protein
MGVTDCLSKLASVRDLTFLHPYFLEDASPAKHRNSPSKFNVDQVTTRQITERMHGYYRALLTAQCCHLEKDAASTIFEQL